VSATHLDAGGGIRWLPGDRPPGSGSSRLQAAYVARVAVARR